MRIAVIQMMYPKGHRRLDEEFVRLLSKEHELILVDDGNYFPRELYANKSNIVHIKVFQPYSNRWEPLKRALRKLSLLLILFRIHNREYDQILFLNCHNVLYEMARFLPDKKRVIIHHNDVDVLFSNKIFYDKFAKVKEQFKHVFLADFISESFMKQTGLSKEYVYTIHQPLVFSNTIENLEKEDLIVGIGNSTDERFIAEVVKYDEKYGDNSLPGKILLRSKCIHYKGSNLEVISGFLPRQEYEKLYQTAKVSVIYYPTSYVYRYSGILDDSLAKGLVVYCNDTRCSRYFANIYPNNVRILNDVDELWQIIGKTLPSSNDVELDLFRQRHSPEYVLVQFNKALKGDEK